MIKASIPHSQWSFIFSFSSNLISQHFLPYLVGGRKKREKEKLIKIYNPRDRMTGPNSRDSHFHRSFLITFHHRVDRKSDLWKHEKGMKIAREQWPLGVSSRLSKSGITFYAGHWIIEKHSLCLSSVVMTVNFWPLFRRLDLDGGVNSESWPLFRGMNMYSLFPPSLGNCATTKDDCRFLCQASLFTDEISPHPLLP